MRWVLSIFIAVLGYSLIDLSNRWPEWSWQGILIGGLGFAVLAHFIDKGLRK